MKNIFTNACAYLTGFHMAFKKAMDGSSDIAFLGVLYYPKEKRFCFSVHGNADDMAEIVNQISKEYPEIGEACIHKVEEMLKDGIRGVLPKN